MTPRLAVTTGLVVSSWVGYAAASAWWFDSSGVEVAPYVYSPLLVVAGAGIGLWLGRGVQETRVAQGLLAVCVFFLASVVVTDGPAKGPIGYANANAAVAVQLMCLAGLLGLRPKLRRVARVAMVVAVLTVLWNRSAGGLVVAVPLALAIWYAGTAGPSRRRWPAALAGVSALTTATLGLAFLARRTEWPPLAMGTLDDVRQLLWLQAWGAFREAETFGRGPGSFEALNILKDPDQSSAHSLPLQVAVELGGIGIGILVVSFLCGVWWALSASTPAHTWVVTAGWSALFVHAFVDHVMEYWPVTLTAGLVLGYGLAAEEPPQVEDEPVELEGAGPSGA